MKITQISHNDLDGYGASTVVGAYVEVARVIHVARYRDVVPLFSAEVNRLQESDEPEMLILTDLGLERPTVEVIRRFAAMNAERPGREHRLVVLDHHASSVNWLTALGFHALPDRDVNHHQACYYTVPGQPLADPLRPDRDPVVVLIDVTRSATKIAYDHAEIYAGPRCRILVREAQLPVESIEPYKALHHLVAGVDAVDLWLRDREDFDTGEAINESFWEVVASFVPEGHELHDLFVSMVLLGVAARAISDSASDMELATVAIRHRTVEMLIAAAGLPETAQERGMTTRMRIARLVGRSDQLFVDLPGPVLTKMAFAMDSGIFQRVADEMLRDGRAGLVINVFRGGQMSLRSRNGEALDLARRLRGGGHPNSCGATLSDKGIFSLADARRIFEETIVAALAQTPA